MKKILTLFLFLVACSFTETFAQGGCYFDQSPEFWKIGSSYNSKLLSACHSSAYYNCHGFAISYFENNCTDPGYTKPTVPAPYACPNAQGVKSASAYQGSGKYVQVCDEANCNIAYYVLSNDTHSAVREVSGGGGVVKYLSKYGTDGPMVAHDLRGSYYHLKGMYISEPTFWAYVGSISGNTSVTGTGPAQFSAPLKAGVTYSWTLSQGGENIYVSSGGNSNVVTLTPLHSGTAKLRLTLSSPCGTPKWQEVNLTVTTNICLEGTYTNNSIQNNLNTANRVATGGVSVTVTCPNATTFTWQKTSGNVNGLFPNNPTISFSMTSGGSISFLVTAKNSSGTTLATRNIAFYNIAGMFSVAPNPSTTSFVIHSDTDSRVSVQVQSLDGQSKKLIQDQPVNTPIDVSDLPPGQYAVTVFENGRAVSRQRVVVRR